MQNLSLSEACERINYEDRINRGLTYPFENIIHDIKTPMSIMYAYIIEMENDLRYETDKLPTIQIIKKYWYRIMKLINDASDFKRINNGGMTPVYKNIDMVYLIGELTNSTKALSGRKNITLNFSSDRKTCVMAVDKNIVERILLNLLSNSIKFTRDGGMIDVLVSVSGDMFYITVKDNGVGIDKDSISRVFELYYSEINEHNPQGVGLGLYIVKELVALLKGDIYVKSAGGTEITVSIPIRIIDEAPLTQNRYSNFYMDNIVQIELSDEY